MTGGIYEESFSFQAHENATKKIAERMRKMERGGQSDTEGEQRIAWKETKVLSVGAPEHNKVSKKSLNDVLKFSTKSNLKIKKEKAARAGKHVSAPKTKAQTQTKIRPQKEDLKEGGAAAADWVQSGPVCNMKLGTMYYRTEDGKVKPWPGSRFIHPVLERIVFAREEDAFYEEIDEMSLERTGVLVISH